MHSIEHSAWHKMHPERMLAMKWLNNVSYYFIIHIGRPVPEDSSGSGGVCVNSVVVAVGRGLGLASTALCTLFDEGFSQICFRFL